MWKNHEVKSYSAGGHGFFSLPTKNLLLCLCPVTQLFGVGDKFEELVVEELLYIESYTLVQGDQQKISLEMMLVFIVCKSVQHSHVKHDFKCGYTRQLLEEI